MGLDQKQQDFATAVLFAGLGLVAYFVLIPHGIDIPASESNRALSPDFWPRLVVITTVVASFAVFIGAFKFNSRNGNETNESDIGDLSNYNFKVMLTRILILLLMFGVFYSSIQSFGLVVTSSILSIVMMVMFGERRYAMVIAISILLPVGLYLFFRYVAGIPIHLGIFANLI